MHFAVSSTAFRKIPIEQVIGFAIQGKFTLEFSSGLPYRADMVDIYRNADIPRLPHNYFPAPKEPFVLNLASLIDEISAKSLEHCRQGLLLAKMANAPFYSVHAGYCIDPPSKELGQKLNAKQTQSREKHWERFMENLRALLIEAKKHDVKLVIENNVFAAFNRQEDGSVPLLCVEHEEIKKMLSELKNLPLGVLIDTGHLKVSAQTLGFNTDEFVRAVAPHVTAIHHSDNDGSADTNGAIHESYWFLEYMPLFKEAHHVLEVHDQSLQDIQRQRELLMKACENE